MVLLSASKTDQGHYTCLKVYLNPFMAIMDHFLVLWIHPVDFFWCCGGLVFICFGLFFLTLPYRSRIAGFKLEFYLKENPQLNTQNNIAGLLSVMCEGSRRNRPTLFHGIKPDN